MINQRKRRSSTNTAACTEARDTDLITITSTISEKREADAMAKKKTAEVMTAVPVRTKVSVQYSKSHQIFKIAPDSESHLLFKIAPFS